MAVANVVTWAGRSILLGKLHGTAGVAEPLNIGWGIANGVTYSNGSQFGDVNLFCPSNPTPEARVAGAVTFAQTASGALVDTFVVAGTITAGANRIINEVGLFDNPTLSPMAILSNTISVATATTIYVGANVAGYANVPQTAGNTYYAQIDNEVVKVTAGQGTATLTVARGQLGTTNATHANNAFFVVGGDGSAGVANSSLGATWPPNGTQLANGGSMFVHGDFANIALNSSDSIAFTLKVQLA